MKRFVSLAAALGLLLASGGIAEAAEHGPAAVLLPLGSTTAAVTSAQRGCNIPAAVDGEPYFEKPTIAIEQGAIGTTEVRIDISSNGALRNADVFSSSGNAWLDAAALRSAHLTHFNAEMLNCKATAGSYLYVVEF